MKGNKTEMELVATETTLAPSEQEQVWLSAEQVAKERARARRNVRSTINVMVKQNTPIEQVVIQLLPTIDDVFSATKASAIMARIGACDAVRFDYDNLNRSRECVALIKSAHVAKEAGTLSMADICTLTEKGVKMDKYCFSFYVVKN